jgi:hypothetical protein
MTAINGVNVNYSNLFQWLAQDIPESTSVLSDPATTDPLLTVASDNTNQSLQAGSGTSNTLQYQIRQAVSSALEQAEKSGNTANLMQIILDAVDQVLKDNGIDPEKLKEQIAAGGTSVEQARHHKQHRHHKKAEEGNSTTELNSTSNNEQPSNPAIDSQTSDLLVQLWTGQNNGQGISGYLLDMGQ